MKIIETFKGWKKWKKIKVVTFAASILGAIQMNLETLRNALTPEQYAWIALAVGVVITVLRYRKSNKDEK